MVKNPQRTNYPGKLQPSTSQTASSDEPPQAFQDQVSPLLLKQGCPPYLIGHYLKWIWQYEKGRKTADQIWNEFVYVAIPLMTIYLQKNDKVTVEFVKRLFQPRDEEGRSLDEIGSERRPWPFLPGSFEMGKHR